MKCPHYVPLILELRILPVTSQLSNPCISLGKQWEASDYIDYPSGGGQQIRAKTHANVFTPLDRII